MAATFHPELSEDRRVHRLFVDLVRNSKFAVDLARGEKQAYKLIERVRSMKAIVCTRYGPPEVLQIQEVPVPAPADNEVLVKVCAASVNPLDSGTMTGPVVDRLFTGG